MAGAYLEFDLASEINQLHRDAESSTGRNAKTLVKCDDFRVVLTTLRAGARMPEHRTEGRISIHAVRGHLRIRAEGRTFDLATGGLLALDAGVAHDVDALEDSALLLTIAWPR
jgi:quercetin dioxygenase-like cupin family protein